MAIQTGVTGTVNGVHTQGPIRVLIIDNQNLLRDGIANLLNSQSDIEVVACSDTVVAAIEAIRKLHPDVVLLGWPASSANANKIFAAIQDAKPRVIMLVDEESKEDFVDAVRQGCCGIVPRQTSTELLIKCIRKVHIGEFWLDRTTTAEVIRRLAKKGTGTANTGARLGLREQGGALSTREREIVVLVAQGFKNKEMAERMFISEQTVKNHLHNIFDKLGVSDRLELALYAIHHNLHDPE
ncbi:MAG TPA: response regulator transcription factor [Bryobacteraceae bacterium]|jgi:DNA-binding NarL/FixJ family response regulator|nr:response regulator transcription factor [Bryobacteraceae bacterium]